MNPETFIKTIFSDNFSDQFGEMAIQLFHYQYDNNLVYRQYVDSLGYNESMVTEIAQIPFLPVSMFKNHRVVCGQADNCLLFESSGTTQTGNSMHLIKDPGLYIESFSRGFELFYGKPENFAIFALLPSYLEREHSSLVYMMEHLIRLSNNNFGGFFLYEHENLVSKINFARENGKKIFLLGVTFSLLDLAEKNPVLPGDCIIVETGGMKGRRREMIREELHSILIQSLGVKTIHSEYGMTELLSQAWSKGDGIYQTPPWMKILIRDANDPFTYVMPGQTGGINVIDLANLYSCAFIATQDLGKINPDGSFEVLGRFDNSDIRGCSLMVT